MSYVALEAITNQNLNMILANKEAQTSSYQYYVKAVSQSLLLSSFEKPQSSRFSGLFV